jgi:hypothetical protein
MVDLEKFLLYLSPYIVGRGGDLEKFLLYPVARKSIKIIQGGRRQKKI